MYDYALGRYLCIYRPCAKCNGCPVASLCRWRWTRWTTCCRTTLMRRLEKWTWEKHSELSRWTSWWRMNGFPTSVGVLYYNQVCPSTFGVITRLSITNAYHKLWCYCYNNGLTVKNSRTPIFMSWVDNG